MWNGGECDLKRRYITKLSKEECKAFFKDNVDVIPLIFGEEAFFGWAILHVFSLSFSSGKLRRYNPIFNKMIGRCVEKNGATHVTFSLYKGLTDFLSLFFIFVGSFIILSIKFYELSALSIAILSILCCLVVSGITFIMTWLSEEGREAEDRLIEFLERNLELENQLYEKL